MSVSKVCQGLVGAVLWLALAATPVFATTVTLAWDPNPPSDGVTSYNVAVSTQAGVFPNPIAVGLRTNWTFTGLQPNTQYFFGVQAISPAGASPVSQIAYITPPTNIPGTEPTRSDFNGDGRLDLLWQNTNTNQLLYWAMSGKTVVASSFLTPQTVAMGWKIGGTGDFNKDGKPDIIFHNQQTGQLVYWLMDGALNYGSGFLPGPVDSTWQIASIRDFDGDGNPDIWWQNQVTGDMLVWYFNGTTFLRSAVPTPSRIADTNWKLVGTADFNVDGHPDALWQNIATGELRVWTLNGIVALSSVNLNPAFVATNWRITAVGDANGDNWPDIVWRNTTNGQMILWTMVGGNMVSADFLSTPSADLSWKIVSPR